MDSGRKGVLLNGVQVWASEILSAAMEFRMTCPAEFNHRS